jgi:hypothetical protein
MKVDQPRHDEVPVRFDLHHIFSHKGARFPDLGDHAIHKDQIAGPIDPDVG